MFFVCKCVDVLLVECGLFESWVWVCVVIEVGLVMVDGKLVVKFLEIIVEDVVIEVEFVYFWVFCGGVKFVGVLECYGIEIEDYVCFDVGVFMGGFIEVLLVNGVSFVFVIDVGMS